MLLALKHRQRQFRLAFVQQDPKAQLPTFCVSVLARQQKRIGWEIAVRIEKILCKALQEAHEQQVEEAMDTLSEASEGF